MRTAVVLAGGAGSRLYPLTDDRPKPMIELLGKPILQWVIEWLRSNCIVNLVIGVAYHKESVMNYFGNGAEFGVNIKYSVHSVDGETGEGFRLAIGRYVKDELFLALNGDEITDFRVDGMIRDHLEHRPMATVAVSHPRSSFAVIKVGRNGYVSSFVEKPLIDSLLVSMGVYLLDRRILSFLPESGPIETETFPRLAERRLLKAYRPRGTWLTVNTQKDLRLVEGVLRERIREGSWPGCHESRMGERMSRIT